MAPPYQDLPLDTRHPHPARPDGEVEAAPQISRPVVIAELMLMLSSQTEVQPPASPQSHKARGPASISPLWANPGSPVMPPQETYFCSYSPERCPEPGMPAAKSKSKLSPQLAKESLKVPGDSQ